MQTEPVCALDIGTSKILTVRQSGNGLKANAETNAFLPLPYSRITENILLQNKVHYYQSNGQFYVYGNNAEKFATLFNAEARRPMSRGLINPDEPSALTLIKVIIGGLVKKPKSNSDLICFSVPGAPVEAPSDLIYHEQLLKAYLEELGYQAKSINEGQAVVFSELENESFSGIGISAGGGMCNVCLAYLSVPVLSFSICKAGGEQAEYLTYKFDTVFIADISWGGGGGEDTPSESLSLAYTKVEMSYKEQDKDGKLGKPVRAAYDISRATA